MKIDYEKKLIDCCKKRDMILKKNLSIKDYNKNYTKMREYARYLIAENNQVVLLPYLESESVSIAFDVAILLFNSYPEKCAEKLKSIAAMNVKEGLPEYYVVVSVAASDNLKYGIPKDFP